MHPETFGIVDWLGVEKLVGQFFNSGAIIETFEMHNESFLLRTNGFDRENAMTRWFNNGELRANLASFDKI